MDLVKIREQVNLMDIKAVILRSGLDGLISGTVADSNVVLLTTEQRVEIEAECLELYAEIKECITRIDEEL